MRNLQSYVAAFLVMALALVGLMWAVRSEAPAAQSGLRHEKDLKFKALPAGADGALKDCVVCHSIEAGGALRVAPNLNGIVGAPKARASWYAYSRALAKAGGAWTDADLDKYLAGPSRFLPGTSKTIVGYADAKRRADIVAALKALR